MTSGDAVIVPPTLVFIVVACRLLPAGCGVLAACSPPAGLSCSLLCPLLGLCPDLTVWGHMTALKATVCGQPEGRSGDR